MGLKKIYSSSSNARNSKLLISGVIMWGMFTDFMYQTTLAPVLPSLLFQLSNPGWEKFLNNLNYSNSVYDKRQIISRIQTEAEVKESTEIGVLLAEKAIVQIIISPFIGNFAIRWGAGNIMLFGFVTLFISATAFSCGPNYWILLASEALHGVASSCIRVAGFGTLAHLYGNENVRETALGYALGAIIMGEIVGIFLGGFGFDLLGQFETFFVIADCAIIGGAIQSFLIQPKSQYIEIKTSDAKFSVLKELLKDPYILIVAGCTFLGNIQFAMLQASLPLHMVETLKSSTWQTGIVFLPESIAFLIGVLLYPAYSQNIHRWYTMKIGLCLTTVSFIMICFSNDFILLLFPIFLCGISTALTDVTTLAELGHLADLRHRAAYERVYSISELANWLGFAFGPIASGVLMKLIGFSGIMLSSAVICLLYITVLHFTNKWFPLQEECNECTMLINPKNGANVHRSIISDCEEIL